MHSTGKIGKIINKKVLKIIKSIEKLKSDYTILHNDINQDLSEREKIDFGDVYTVIGPTPRHINFSNKMAYPTEFYLKRSKIYQSKEKEKDEEIKDS